MSYLVNFYVAYIACNNFRVGFKYNVTQRCRVWVIFPNYFVNLDIGIGIRIGIGIDIDIGIDIGIGIGIWIGIGIGIGIGTATNILHHLRHLYQLNGLN